MLVRDGVAHSASTELLQPMTGISMPAAESAFWAPMAMMSSEPMMAENGSCCLSRR